MAIVCPACMPKALFHPPFIVSRLFPSPPFLLPSALHARTQDPSSHASLQWSLPFFSGRGAQRDNWGDGEIERESNLREKGWSGKKHQTALAATFSGLSNARHSQVCRRKVRKGDKKYISHLHYYRQRGIICYFFVAFSLSCGGCCARYVASASSFFWERLVRLLTSPYALISLWLAL